MATENTYMETFLLNTDQNATLITQNTAYLEGLHFESFQLSHTTQAGFPCNAFDS